MTCNDSHWLILKAHSKSLQLITTRHRPVQLVMTILFKPLQFITTHYNPLQAKLISYKFLCQCNQSHYSSLQSITTHYNQIQLSIIISIKPLQVITIHYNPLQSISINPKSPFKPLPFSPSHSRNSPLENKYYFFLKISLQLNEISLQLYPKGWNCNGIYQELSLQFSFLIGRG